MAVPDFDEDRLVGVDQFGFVFGDQEALVGVVGADGLPEVRKAVIELAVLPVRLKRDVEILDDGAVVVVGRAFDDLQVNDETR